MKEYEQEIWYKNLSDDGQYVYDQIIKYHDYFSAKDKCYRRAVRIVKVLVLALSMLNTVIMGLRKVIKSEEYIIIAGLFLSSFITFFTSISAYFNLENYWMRNVQIHLRLNRFRDDFQYDAKAGNLDGDRVRHYQHELGNIQKENAQYWKKAIRGI